MKWHPRIYGETKFNGDGPIRAGCGLQSHCFSCRVCFAAPDGHDNSLTEFWGGQFMCFESERLIILI